MKSIYKIDKKRFYPTINIIELCINNGHTMFYYTYFREESEQRLIYSDSIISGTHARHMLTCVTRYCERKKVETMRDHISWKYLINIDTKANTIIKE